MERVKVFYACNDTIRLESRINKWLESESIEITRVLQSAAGRLDHHVTVTIFYKKVA